jgi:hypothetical protein
MIYTTASWNCAKHLENKMIRDLPIKRVPTRASLIWPISILAKQIVLTCWLFSGCNDTLRSSSDAKVAQTDTGGELVTGGPMIFPEAGTIRPRFEDKNWCYCGENLQKQRCKCFTLDCDENRCNNSCPTTIEFIFSNGFICNDIGLVCAKDLGKCRCIKADSGVSTWYCDVLPL